MVTRLQVRVPVAAVARKRPVPTALTAKQWM
jgi:hypothetical protein